MWGNPNEIELNLIIKVLSYHGRIVKENPFNAVAIKLLKKYKTRRSAQETFKFNFLK
jgi:hypothetical protein